LLALTTNVQLGTTPVCGKASRNEVGLSSEEPLTEAVSWNNR
jgi:hypothetical protein